jgi:hypothetical protein
MTFELAVHRGEFIFMRSGGCRLPLATYRLPRAGGGQGMEAPSGSSQAPYRHRRDPMYLGSSLVLVHAHIARPPPHRRVLRDEHWLEARFGPAYRSNVTRRPGIR